MCLCLIPVPRFYALYTQQVDLGWLRPGGRLCLLEPNGRNPLIWLQSRIVPAEAGARASECRLGKGGEARECEQRQGHEQR